MFRLVERVRWIWGVLIAPAGRAPRVVVALACLAIVGMYCTNQDMNGDPESPRGDGVYRPVLARGDGHMMYLMARSTALDGDWVFDNDLARFGDPWRQPRTHTGRKSIAHPLGPALVWTPLIWMAQVGAVIANSFGADIQLHGYTLWHQRFVFLSSALFACGAVLLGRRLARRFVGGRWAPSYAAVAVLLGTSLTYYATFMPSYAHAMDAFACAGFLTYWAETLGRRDLRRWLVLGALLGLATLIRVQELAMGIVVALEVSVEVVAAARGRRLADAARWLGGGALALMAAIVVFSPQLLEWHLVFGSITELPQGAKYTRLEAPMVMEVLFSARNGWLSTTPIAYAAVLGLVLVPRRHRLLGAGLIAAVAIQIYLNSTILDWWGSAAFGQRRMTNVTLPLVVGLAALISAVGRAVARWAWAARVGTRVSTAVGRGLERLRRRPQPDSVPSTPPVISHALVIILLGGFAGWNLARVGELRGGKPAPSELSRTCCGAVPSPLRPVASWCYDRIGNPFELPASAVFAVRHGVELSRWDQVVGNYPLVPALDTLLDDRLWQQRGSWKIGSPGIERYLIDGFSPSVRVQVPALPGRAAPRGVAEVDIRELRWTVAPRATVMVPNLMPYGQRFTLWLAPGGSNRAVVRWNGTVVAEATVSGWTAVSFELPDIELHTNELTIEAEPRPFTPSAGWPTPGQPVGVAVGTLEIAFLPPPAR